MRVILACAALLLVPSATRAADCHAEPAAAPRATAPAQVRVVDAALRDHRGEGVRFADALGDGVVVIDFVFTSCTTICPVLSATFAQVQERLGPRLGSEVRLLSLTLDPARDTPDRLAAYAAKHGAKPGWAWLTGDADQMKSVLQGLGGWTPDFTRHPPAVLVGDPARGVWTRINGFVDPAQIVARVDELLAARHASAEAHR
jgi:protein SCO1/2